MVRWESVRAAVRRDRRVRVVIPVAVRWGLVVTQAGRRDLVGIREVRQDRAVIRAGRPGLVVRWVSRELPQLTWVLCSETRRPIS